MAINPDNLLGQSNPNGTVGVSLGIDPIGANEAFSAGVTSGFQVSPTSPAGMSVAVGGQVGVIDSALVRSTSGITFPVGNTSGTPITLTVPAAPTTNSRIDSIVLYVDTTVTATETDGADALGMEIVSGTSASSPVAPTDAQIRSAIQNGASIAYVVIANITVASGATTITASDIAQATPAQVGADKVDFATYSKTGLVAGENTISLSAGKWFVSAMATFQTNSSRGYGGVSIEKNGTPIYAGFQHCEAQYSWGQVSVSGILELDSSDVVTCELGRSGSQIIFANSPTIRNVFSAFRIG